MDAGRSAAGARPHPGHHRLPLPGRRLAAPAPAAPAPAAGLRQAGPSTPEPSYAHIEEQPLNRAIMAMFRRKMVDALGKDSRLQGYDAIIDLTRELNAKYATARETQLATRAILNSLFPAWLPPAFKVLFSQPMPDFSCRMNAWVTALTCKWLMGPCEVNDVQRPDGTVASGMGVLVERCRYLEQSGCASICINSCKVPTQEFFSADMGLPLTMTPNYDDFSCQFSFGVTPVPIEQDEAFSTPCFLQCPSKAKRYAATKASPQPAAPAAAAAAAATPPPPPAAAEAQQCPNIPV